jgi:Tfp pilus assembly protein PilF
LAKPAQQSNAGREAAMQKANWALLVLAMATAAPVAASATPDELEAWGVTVSAGAAPGYVQTRDCTLGGCHAERYRAFQATDTARSFRPPRPEWFVEDFAKTRFYHEPSRRYYELTRRGDELWFRRYQADDQGAPINVIEQRVDWLQGAGTLVRTYFYQTPRGEIYQLPVAWFVRTRSLGMAPGYDRPRHFGIRRPVRRECQFCHNDYAELPAGADRFGEPQIFPRRLPAGIGCQRCHGPGAEHTRLGLLAQRPGAQVDPKLLRGSIVNPGRLSPALHNDICYQCHARQSMAIPALTSFGRGDLSFRPGEPLADYLVDFRLTLEKVDNPLHIGAISQPPRMEMSACFTKSGGRLLCSTCHDSHRRIPDAEKSAHYRRACLSCHASDACPTARGQVLASSGAATSAGQTPIPAPDALASVDCVGCHMPKRGSNVVEFPVTEHFIQRRPDLSAAETSGRKTDPVVLDAQPLNVTGDIADLYRTAGAVRAGGGGEAALLRLEQILQAHPQEALDTYLILAEGLLRQHLWDRAEACLVDILRRSPEHPLALSWRAIAAHRLDRRDEAIGFLKQALGHDPSLPEARYNLGLFLLEAGRLDEAADSLRLAVESRPNQVEAWFYWGKTCRVQGRLREAVERYRRALEIEPSYTEAYLEIASTLTQLGDRPEALRFLRVGAKTAAEPDVVAAELAPAKE